jgi:hypothetical protein
MSHFLHQPTCLFLYFTVSLTLLQTAKTEGNFSTGTVSVCVVLFLGEHPLVKRQAQLRLVELPCLSALG